MPKSKLLYRLPPSRNGKKKEKVTDLMRVYTDLEKTIRGLKATAKRDAECALLHIDMKKLIRQLSRSKKRLERKIGNTLLLEKQHLKRRLGSIAATLTHKEDRA